MKRLTFPQIVLFIPVFLFAFALFPRENKEPAWLKNLSPQVQEALRKSSLNRVESFCANIWQSLSGPKGYEKRIGTYCAARNLFRADFSRPNEKIVYDGKKITWKIEGNPFTWVIENQTQSGIPDSRGGKIPQEGFQIREVPLPFWKRWFRPKQIELEVLSPSQAAYRLLITLDLSIPGITERKLVANTGATLMRELYRKPIWVRGSLFFREIEVLVRGKIPIRNRTVYSDIRVNPSLSADFFRPLGGPFRVYR